MDVQSTSNDDLKSLRHDIDQLALATKRGFDSVEAKIAKMATNEELSKLASDLHDLRADVRRSEANMATKDGLQAVLNILNENTELLRELRQMPERVDRLERTVFRS